MSKTANGVDEDLPEQPDGREPARLLYLRPTDRGVWLLVLFSPIGALAAAYDARDMNAAIVTSIVCIVLMTLTLWIAIGWSGRRRVAEVWLDGDMLKVRRSDLFNRGKVLKIPLAETSNWKALLENYSKHRLEVAEFDHEGHTFTLQVSGSQFVDLDTFNAWVASGRPQLEAQTGLPHQA